MNYNIYRIFRDKWNTIVNNHSRQHHNPPSGNQFHMGTKARSSNSRVKLWRQQSAKRCIMNNKTYVQISSVSSEEA